MPEALGGGKPRRPYDAEGISADDSATRPGREMEAAFAQFARVHILSPSLSLVVPVYNSQSTLPRLKQSTNLADQMLLLGLGWLAREGKVALLRDRRTVKVQLHREGA